MTQQVSGDYSFLADFVQRCAVEGVSEEKILQDEIDTITKEIKELIGEESQAQQSVIDKNLLRRVDECIATLAAVEGYMKSKNQIKQSILFQGEEAINLSRKENKRKMKEAFTQADDATKKAIKKALHEAKQEIYKQHSEEKIKAAIREGYMIITLLRENITNQEIQYKIIAAGQIGNGGDPILYESHPNLAEVLKFAKFDSTSFSLRLDMTKKQFQKLASTETQNKSSNLSKLKNSLLNDMQRVSLKGVEQQNMLKKFIAIKRDLSTISGAMINYGQLIESYEEYLLNQSSISVDDVYGIYNLLEKGINNLAYYLGGDIEKNEIIDGKEITTYYQVKVLSAFSDQRHGGRVDIARYSNVLNPLRQIRNDLALLTDGKEIRKAFENFFTVDSRSGQGDRKFNEKLEDVIVGTIEHATFKD